MNHEDVAVVSRFETMVTTAANCKEIVVWKVQDFHFHCLLEKSSKIPKKSLSCLYFSKDAVQKLRSTLEMSIKFFFKLSRSSRFVIILPLFPKFWGSFVSLLVCTFVCIKKAGKKNINLRIFGK